ncbi:MAG: alpha/beta fold hydrolase [Chloroflexi bacterium]|nr:alpha/beta fold hydrolase [Chloroflexota bacterium]
MQSVRANGLDIAYEDTGGEGAPVVLIHGHSVDLRMWPLQMLALREAGYRVVRYDVRGHGHTTAPGNGYTWPVYSADLHGLLDALSLPSVHLAGFSMGGGIALQYALDHPERVASLTLIDSAVPGFTYSDEFAAGIEALVEAVRAEGWRRAAERLWLPHPMFDGLRRHPAAFRVLRDLVLDYPARDYLVDPPNPEEPEAVSRLHELAMPVQVLVGAEDLVDFLLAAQLVAANAPRSRLEVVAGAGHVLPLERPNDVNRLLLEFLSDPDAATAPPVPVIQVRRATVQELSSVAAIDAGYDTGRMLRLDRRGHAPELRFDFTVIQAGPLSGDEPSARDDRWHDLLDEGAEVLVAAVEGEVVGAVTLQEHGRERRLDVADIRVLPEARGHGIGRALLDHAAALGRGRELLALYIEVPSDNLDAVAFCLKYGFRFSGFDDRRYLHRFPDPERRNRIALSFTYELS